MLISSDSPVSMSPAARRSEIATILAAGIVRLKSRAAIPNLDHFEDSSESPGTYLELPLESVLSVTNVVNDE